MHSHFIQRATRAIAAALLATLLAACGGYDSTAAPAAQGAPVIASFAVTPTAQPLGGGQVVLSWNAPYATTLVTDNGVGDVSGLSSKAVNVAASTTFTLTASNAAGTASATTAVTVARLLDAGITESGERYLVLEYVDGERIDRYCDRRRLSVAQRVALFIRRLPGRRACAGEPRRPPRPHDQTLSSEVLKINRARVNHGLPVDDLRNDPHVGPRVDPHKDLTAPEQGCSVETEGCDRGSFRDAGHRRGLHVELREVPVDQDLAHLVLDADCRDGC